MEVWEEPRRTNRRQTRIGGGKCQKQKLDELEDEVLDVGINQVPGVSK